MYVENHLHNSGGVLKTSPVQNRPSFFLFLILWMHDLAIKSKTMHRYQPLQLFIVSGLQCLQSSEMDSLDLIAIIRRKCLGVV